MKRGRKILVVLALSFVFLLVYSPHFNYSFPYHVDEWHHLSESIRLGNYGEYLDAFRAGTARGFSGLEIGFHFALFLLSFLVILISVYQFLPAIFAVLGALALFYLVYRKTDGNFWLGFFAIIFFASIKSNVNVTGLWFFTPMTFSIPLIFLYFYFFDQGVGQQKPKSLLISFGLMTVLLFVHSVSFIFSLPALIIYSLLNHQFLLKEYKLFLVPLAVLVLGVLFYKYALDIPNFLLASRVLSDLQFEYGWGIVELKNSLLEVYSTVGYLLAALGMVFAVFKLKALKKYLLFLLWPATLIIMIIIFRISGVSYLSPYQRNLYYLVISLPLFSALGLYYSLEIVKDWLAGFNFSSEIKKSITLVAVSLILTLTGILLFSNYYILPRQIDLYQVISDDDYRLLKLFADLPPTRIMATPFMSTALYPIARQQPIGTLAFYGDRQAVEDFFSAESCVKKLQLLKKYAVGYVISPIALECNFGPFYQKYN